MKHFVQSHFERLKYFVQSHFHELLNVHRYIFGSLARVCGFHKRVPNNLVISKRDLFVSDVLKHADRSSFGNTEQLHLVVMCRMTTKCSPFLEELSCVNYTESHQYALCSSILSFSTSVVKMDLVCPTSFVAVWNSIRNVCFLLIFFIIFN